MIFINYYNEIKNKLIDNEIYNRVKDYSKERNKVITYFEIGKLLQEAGKHYGEGIIKDYSKKLTNEFGKGYTPTRLRYIRRFYEVFMKYPTLSDKLSYSHYCELIWFDIDKINYYIKITEEENLSVRKLRQKIKSNEYERLDEETKKLKIKEELSVPDLVKNPIQIKKQVVTMKYQKKYFKK